jgi:gamma-glutamylcyclotransferase (GGCT)/AIG2-like uncharacterized protein YtfP
MFYFAYGSNMDWTQMRSRCPSARFIATAVLRDHRLAFTRRSLKRDCGVADAVWEKGKIIWGILFEIDDAELDGLDESEGYRVGRVTNSYRREQRRVLVNGDSKQPTEAQLYFAVSQVNPPRPSAAYKNLILSGAREWHLPAEYIGALEAIEATG